MKKAIKYDKDKAPIGLIPGEALVAAAHAFGFGRELYGQFNYKQGMEWMRIVDAAYRHITAFKDGESAAPDSGVSHLGHAIACLAMLVDYEVNGLGTDDRYKKVKK